MKQNLESEVFVIPHWSKGFIFLIRQQAFIILERQWETAARNRSAHQGSHREIAL
jgi:hypothetical protein